MDEVAHALQASPPPWAQELAARLDRIEAALQPTALPPVVSVAAGPVLSTQAAAAYIGFRSKSPFYAWARRWHVSPCGHNQWARHHLDAGRRRQAERGRRIIRADDRRRQSKRNRTAA